MKCTVRRININLTEIEENCLDYLDYVYYHTVKEKYSEADIVRNAIRIYAQKLDMPSDWNRKNWMDIPE